MAFIDTTYFKGKIWLPVDNEYASTFIEQLIDQAERDVLLNALGYSLYTEFMNGLAEDAPDEKWLKLRDGAEFTIPILGKDFYTKWPGIKNIEKDSLIAYYVYYQYLMNRSATVGQNGLTIQNPQNAVIASPLDVATEGYNQYVKRYGIDVHSKFEITIDDDYSIDDNYYPSLYNFIYEMNEQNGEDYYPNWQFKPIKYRACGI